MTTASIITTEGTKPYRSFGESLANFFSNFYEEYLRPKKVADFRIINHTIETPVWPSENGALKIAFITDPHIGSPDMTAEAMDRIVAQVNASNPDIVLLGGDYVMEAKRWIKHSDYNVEAIADSLGKLKSRYGTYATLGNHDWVTKEDQRSAF